MTERWPTSDPHPTDEILLDLALDELPPAQRSQVSSHVDLCPACRGRFSAVADGIDHVLAAAPWVAPPLGLAQSTLEAMGVGPGSQTVRAAEQRRASALGAGRRAGLLMAAAAAVALVVGFGLGALTHPGSVSPAEVAEQPAAPSGRALVTGAGQRVGELLPARYEGRDVFVVTVSGREGAWYSCELTLADGSRQKVGSWVLPEGHVTWVVDRPEHAVTGMTLIGASGRAWATAEL